MNLPNKLTVARIVLIPLFVFFMIRGLFGDVDKWIALAIFIIAAITDYLDGAIARERNLVTNFGKFMDPLADKLLVSAALICLMAVSSLSPWVVIIIISREFIISGFRLIASNSGIVIAAGIWGKAKTVSQMTMIIILIADLGGIFYTLGQISIWAAVALTIFSLIDYIYRNRKVLTRGGM